MNVALGLQSLAPLQQSGGHSNIVIIIAAIIAVGIGAQVIADRFRVPSVLFLILAGIIMGPEGLDLIHFAPETLSAIVGISVAIIVFEGAFHLKLDKIRTAPSAAVNLVTIGALIAFLGTSAAVHFLLPAAWDISLLIGALLVATGPTVITPILEVVPVRDRVAAALEVEGIVNDVTAAILAIVVFKGVTAERLEDVQFVSLFFERLGAGLIVGGVVALVLWYLFEHVDLSRGSAPQHARLLTLAGAIVAFAGANTIAKEAGVAAAATAGILLGNADVPYEEQIEEFKGDMTLIVLSFVFIALAAQIEFSTLAVVGWRGLLVAVLVGVVIRPLLAWISTSGERFTRNERLFIGLVGPRGIIPASVATLFALELQTLAAETNTPELAAEADLLLGTVFLTILLTVVFQGGLARQIAEKLDVLPMRVLIVGGGRVGLALAERLEDRGENVVIVDDRKDSIETARERGFTVHQGDGTDSEVLEQSGADHAKTVIAATGNDDANLLVAQLASSKFDVERVLARVNEPSNVDAFEDLGVETVSSSLATAWAIDNMIERPALSDWMTKIGRSGDVQEIEVTAEDLTGRTIDDLDDEIPNGAIIALVSRNGDNRIPEPDFTLEYGDHITFIGRTEAVHNAIDRWHPHD
ncbi:sodium/proton antiporter, CPA1 family [Natronoarchaeum philippinense]|uniref:Sodium/proton antiporter, CPA1 family n=1 Tax=Natronoarchaeum philippinense TaxID=558529 RepID=A0A285P8P1_NATPI|nr:cation:proton antiporter [Natronoarchaeum philippinense]SNZ16251.1 sodium/proton antiporter, CPA1 family [Natronoarchaeum philippinense]